MNRRSFLSLTGAALAGSGVKGLAQQHGHTSAASTPSAPVNTVKRDRPNILFLMADQLRMDCVGTYGNKAIRTPNLDGLAKQGIRFNCAYTTTPSCTPARSALLTGLGPWSHGMLGYSRMATRPYPVEMPKAMANAGYYTTSIGKNHFHPIRNPHGYHHMITYEGEEGGQFDAPYNLVANAQMRPDYYGWFWSMLPDKDPLATGLDFNDYRGKPFAYADETLHPTYWTGETAVRFLSSYDRQEPFFLKVSFHRPHSPYDPPKRWFKAYEDAPLPAAEAGAWAKKYEPRSGPTNTIWHGKMPAAVERQSRQAYYGSVSFVDEQIGRILEVLEKRKLLDETLILFVSDHGDMLGDQNLWRKTYGYEQSAHVPMLLRPAAGMGLGPKGQVVQNPVEIRDILPTFLDTAEAAIPESVEGKSLLHLIKEKGEGWRSYIDLEHNVCYSPTNHWNGLTDGHWKYLYMALDGEEQLFHIDEDPNELKNLSGLPNYSAELLRWRKRLVSHLEIRGSDWVQQGKLVPRPQGLAFSPHFPGQLSDAALVKMCLATA